jgi:alanyl-tRNA synthetase
MGEQGNVAPYFKALAIELAWNLITKEFGLSKERLLVTVYHTDDEAADLWKKIAGFTDDKIIRIPTSDNFWQMGDTGPCGPCSEDLHRPGRQALGRPARLRGRGRRPVPGVLEPRLHAVRADRARQPHPAAEASIDTGMGLERIAAGAPGRALELRHGPVPHPHRGRAPRDRRRAGRASARLRTG